MESCLCSVVYQFPPGIFRPEFRWPTRVMHKYKIRFGQRECELRQRIMSNPIIRPCCWAGVIECGRKQQAQALNRVKMLAGEVTVLISEMRQPFSAGMFIQPVTTAFRQ